MIGYASPLRKTLVRFGLASTRRRVCSHFSYHPLPSSEDAAFYFIGDPLPRQFGKCAEARYNRHDVVFVVKR